MGAKLTLEDVRAILALLDASTFDELHIETDDLKLSLSRNGAPAASAALVPAPVPAASPAPRPAAPAPAAPADTSDLVDIPAPMLGLFYRAPKPGAEPYVTVGATIAPDTVIGIIEVMKLMNSVPAGLAGEVVAIVAQDATLVEYGQPILRVRPH